MKRWYPALAVTTLAAAVCGMVLSLTLGSGTGLRGALSQGTA